MQEILVILLIFCASYFLINRNFKFSIYILLLISVLLHKELFSFYKWDVLPSRIFMLAFLCSFVTDVYLVIFKKKPHIPLRVFYTDPFFILMFLLWLVRGISLISTANLQQSLLLFGFFTTMVVLFCYIYFYFRDKPEEILKYLRFYTFIVFGLTLFGYFQLFLYLKTGKIIAALWNIPGNIPRVGATFWDVNHYASLLASLLPLLGIYILIDPKWKNRVLNMVMFLSIFASLLLTNSRSGWIMAFVSFISFITLMLIRKFGIKGILYIFIALLLISAPFVREYNIKSSPFRAKVKQYFHYRLDSFDSHFLLLTGAYQVFEKYPLIGGGYGSFFEHFSKTKIAPTYYGRDPAALNTRVPPHTIWGELISETGILGLSVYTSFFVLFVMLLFYSALTSKDKSKFLIAAAIGSTIVGWHVAGIFYSYNSEFFWIMLIFFLTWGFSALPAGESTTNVMNYFFKSSKTSLFAILLIAFLLIFLGLGNNSLIPWDEAIYAKVAKNMVTSGDYITERWYPTKIWYEKPPLYMWSMSWFMKYLGFTSWAARLPGAIFGFALVIITYLFAKKHFGKVAGFLSALILLTTTQFLYYSRTSMLDVTTSFFISGALFIYLNTIYPNNKHADKTLSRKKQLLSWGLIGFLIGLGGMTKGVIGLLPFPIIGIWEIYLYVKKQQYLSKNYISNYLLCLLTFILVFLPWHLVMYQKYGFDFVQNYFVYHVWDRATTNMENKGEPIYWYLIVLKVSMRIWFIALLISLPVIIKKFIRNNIVYRFLVVAGLLIFSFFSVSTSKLVWYIIPLYPLLSILIGASLNEILNFGLDRLKVKNKFLLKLLLVILIADFGLFYLFLNRDKVYTSDLTGSQARLLQMKDSEFGVDQLVYTDRIEIPLLLFYTDGPYKNIDFNVQRPESIPKVAYDKKLVLLTKKGRYSATIPAKDYEALTVAEDGDYILWYFNSEYDVDKSRLNTVSNTLKQLSNPNTPKTVEVYKQITELNQQQMLLTTKIQAKLKSLQPSNK